MNHFHQLFPLRHSWLLIVSILLAVIAIILSSAGKSRLAIITLALATFFIRIFVVYLDPFLHPWDEKFHALVARNMMDHPFKPVLEAHPVLKYDFTAWCCNSIWLHKQPLFLWQMALSMKIFGISEYAIRYPSVLLGVSAVLLVYRIGFLLSNNAKTAFTAALLMCFAYYPLELISGYIGMDANDVSFDFYVLASIWAYAEYSQNKKASWAALIGVFVGCAVLNKWLTGFLVFSAWGMHILMGIRQKDTKKEIGHLLLSLIISCIIFLPWQFYILHAFPMEAKYEYAFNSRHISEVIEGHEGGKWYYYDEFKRYFGKGLWVLMLVGMVLPLAIKRYRGRLSFTLTWCFLIVFCFFSFLVKTKIYNYFVVVVPIGILFIAVMSEFLLDNRMGKYLRMPAQLAMLFLIFQIPLITQNHDPKDVSLNDWEIRKENDDIYRNVKKSLPPDVKVVCNTKDFDNIDVMFYNNDLSVYNWCLGRADLDIVKQQGLKIGVFESHNPFNVPDSIAKDPSVTMINQLIK